MKSFWTLLFLMIAIASVAYAEDAEFSGQGIPRDAKADCLSAAQKLESKLKIQGLKEVSANCDTQMGGDFGGFVPALKAKAAKKFTMSNDIGSYRSKKEECEQDLKSLQAKLKASEMLEGECRQSGLDFQAWLTKLVAEPESAAPKAQSFVGIYESPSKATSVRTAR